ncbi:hypothetical protein GCM10009680_02750 [Streptomyces yatensis]|uniref:Uncharacterized protein n=1 Tax=Streptomyces yatensis TaxID=155177 RepID=A0ABN2G7H9_9ACTN
MHRAEQQCEFGGAGAGRGEDGDLGVGAADVDRAAQIAAVGDDDLGVVPGHPGPGEGGGDGGDGGDDLDLESVLGSAQGADDAEEAGVAVGQDHGGAAVLGDPAGREVHAAEPDPLGARRDFGQRQVVGGAGHEGGCREGGAGRVRQRGAVPTDHRDAVGHRPCSPLCVAGSGLSGASRWAACVAWCACEGSRAGRGRCAADARGTVPDAAEARVLGADEEYPGWSGPLERGRAWGWCAGGAGGANAPDLRPGRGAAGRQPQSE